MSVPVVLFGSVPLATWAAKMTIQNRLTDLVGVVCQRKSEDFLHHNLEFECVYDFARKAGVEILDLGDLASVIEPERGYLGVSVRFHRLLSDETINLFKRGIVNLHGGELPRYRGVNIANHSILEGSQRGGATLHYIDQGIDTGPIIARDFFEISQDDTAYDVFLKTQSTLMSLFDEHIDAIALGRIDPVPQRVYLERGEQSATYYRDDITTLKEVDLSHSPEDLYRRVRAFDFPGHEPAYIVVRGKRLYLSTRYSR